jgi:hypothetical protein
LTLKIPQRHSHPGDLVVGRGAIATTIGRDHAAGRGQALGGDRVPGPGFPPGLARSRKRQVIARHDPASRLAAPPPAALPRSDAGGHVQDRGDRDPQVELVLAVLPDHEEDEKCVDQANPDLSAEWRTTSDAVAYLG